MTNIINFTAYRNQQRANAESAKREADKQARNKERVINAAQAGAQIGIAFGGSLDAAIIGAKEAAKSEQERIAQEEKERADRYMPAYCDPDNEYRGSRYDATKDLSLKDVAKRIRQDIKQMIAAGTLPKGIKVSVRMDGYNALRINITALPESIRVYTEGYARASKNWTQPADRYSGFFDEVYTDEFQAIVDALDANTNSYNRDNSDIMTDYFDVRFYDGRASLGWELSQAVQAREAVDLESEQ